MTDHQETLTDAALEARKGHEARKRRQAECMPDSRDTEDAKVPATPDPPAADSGSSDIGELVCAG
jgi:hypothetical protein